MQILILPARFRALPRGHISIELHGVCLASAPQNKAATNFHKLSRIASRFAAK
jgi:hypothetical protein